ncbi:hypothetical protein N0V82_006086 [Gnomoniopsis sp. IMI 355080]|nr:hypothetical protein N0V82_006086 [Gnomoniopsis sp. IMI 355080]
MEPLTYQSSLIAPEEAAHTGCFTTLPIRCHAQDDLANDASRRFMRDWAREMGDGRETKTYFSFSPVGNWSSLIYPEAIPERLGVLASLSDLGLIHDDSGEELTVEDAQTEHEELRSALDPDAESRSGIGNGSIYLAPDAQTRASKTKKLVSQYMLECISLDRELGLAMLAAFRDVWLAIGEKHGDKKAENVDEYLQLRSDNGGMLLGMSISTAEQTLVQPIIDAATRGLLLANDFFSWEREYRELQSGQSKRMVSAVELFVRTQGLSIQAAKGQVKSMIIESEHDFCRLRDELYRKYPDTSYKLRRWIDSVGLAVSGNHYWCSACPRQNAWKTESQRKVKRTLEETQENPQPCYTQHQPRKKPRRDSVVAVSSNTSDGTYPSCLPSSCSSPVSHYPLQAAPSAALDAPLLYMAGMPSKGVRGVLIEALNTWLKVPAAAIASITSVVNSLHTASLILDDVQDNSPLRRGRPAVHTIFGAAQAVNSANVLFVRAIREATERLRPASLAVVLEELENLHRGQSLDLAWKHNLECPSEADYVNMVDHKTGGMFRMLVRMMLAESESSSSSNVSVKAESLAPLTKLFGRFFQIRDDYMNFGEYAMQKGFCEDLDEGKFSYPVVHCLANYPEYRMHILGVFRQRPTAATATPAPLTQEMKMHLLDCLVESGSLDRTLDVIKNLEKDLEGVIERVEELSGETNPMLRICLEKLSTKDISRVSRL